VSTIPGGSLEGVRVLDPFAGSGALGLELLSRGAGECLFIEKNRSAVSVLKANLAALGLRAPVARVCMADSLSPKLPACIKEATPFDIVALDPPYHLPLSRIQELLSTLGRAELVVNHSLVSYEHAAADVEDMDNFSLDTTHTPVTLHLVKRKIYGTICLDYYVCS
jgi:16S rRNA (guanine966-N2)-methyltransferase